jgi:hypothetical protein
MEKERLHKQDELSLQELPRYSELPSTPLSQDLDNGSKQTCEGCDNLSTSIEKVKQKCAKSSKQEKIKLLTLELKSWSVQITAAVF